MVYAKLYTVSRKKADDEPRMKRQINLAIERLCNQLYSQGVLVSKVEGMVSDQHADYFVQNKVAVLIKATAPENEITIISES